jgi:HPt (histidine-containing phosphotransfer) domain-containing protein
MTSRKETMPKELIQPFILETGLSETVALRIFAKFFATLQAELEQIATAVAQQNWPQASMLAHTLKGSSGNLRLMDLSHQASLLDLSCRGQLADQAQANLAGLSNLVGQLIDQYAA